MTDRSTIVSAVIVIACSFAAGCILTFSLMHTGHVTKDLKAQVKSDAAVSKQTDANIKTGNAVEKDLLTHGKSIDKALDAGQARIAAVKFPVPAVPCPSGGYVIQPGPDPDALWAVFADAHNRVRNAGEAAGAGAADDSAGDASVMPAGPP